MLRASTAGLVLGVLAAARLDAQAPPAVSPADAATIDALVRASYDVMNGPAGQPRQWRRDSSLYMPAATFVAVREVDGHAQARVMTPEEYRRASFPRFERDGGYETEIGRHTERFGNVAQVRSVAVSRHTPDGPISARYVNYYQVYWDGSRWWIAGMVWDEETPARPIPAAWVGRWEESAR
jgi:hypothetical protein